MEYDVEKGEIRTDKILNELDLFTIDFVNILEKHVDYVIVSGYVAILLGRSRASEDVDFLIPPMNFEAFQSLFSDLIEKGFECANTMNIEEAYEMLDEHAIKFFRDGVPIPHIEFKKISNVIHRRTFESKIKVITKIKTLFISPLELQIAYKLSLMANGPLEEISSDKDFEDAKHIYESFKEKINKDELLRYLEEFDVKDKWELLEK